MPARNFRTTFGFCQDKKNRHMKIGVFIISFDLRLDFTSQEHLP